MWQNERTDAVRWKGQRRLRETIQFYPNVRHNISEIFKWDFTFEFIDFIMVMLVALLRLENCKLTKKNDSSEEREREKSTVNQQKRFFSLDFSSFFQFFLSRSSLLFCSTRCDVCFSSIYIRNFFSFSSTSAFSLFIVSVVVSEWLSHTNIFNFKFEFSCCLLHDDQTKQEERIVSFFSGSFLFGWTIKAVEK